MTDDKNKQKVFLALWPEESVRHQLYDRGLRLKCSGKKIPVENLHMTLVFIGYASPQEVKCIQNIASHKKYNRFTLTIDRVGTFRNSILWLGCTQSPQLLFNLQNELSEKLQQYCGVRLEKRKFSPHITISRKIKQTPTLARVEPLIWEVNNFVLMKSEPGDFMSQYTVLDSWDLRS